MNIRLSIRRYRRALLVVLLSVVFLFAAKVTFASPEGGSHGIPWRDIAKQAINLAILIGVLIYFIRKPLSSFMKERSELMRKSIEDASVARAEAMKKLEAMDARMARLSEEIAKLNERAESESAAEAQVLRDTATTEIGRIRAQAELSGEQELKKAVAELRQEASLLVSEAAETLVKNSLSSQDQERLVKENIEKIERIV
ncbi:MAG: ATP synthase F0 subunit B [Syntrophorhabdaceae bacterium]|nr:ATP synthase F0 subunit B [Syntrophorhabdaceae bacterium]